MAAGTTEVTIFDLVSQSNGPTQSVGLCRTYSSSSRSIIDCHWLSISVESLVCMIRMCSVSSGHAGCAVSHMVQQQSLPVATNSIALPVSSKLTGRQAAAASLLRRYSLYAPSRHWWGGGDRTMHRWMRGLESVVSRDISMPTVRPMVQYGIASLHRCRVHAGPRYRVVRVVVESTVRSLSFGVARLGLPSPLLQTVPVYMSVPGFHKQQHHRRRAPAWTTILVERSDPCACVVRLRVCPCTWGVRGELALLLRLPGLEVGMAAPITLLFISAAAEA